MIKKCNKVVIFFTHHRLTKGYEKPKGKQCNCVYIIKRNREWSRVRQKINTREEKTVDKIAR